MLLEHECLSWVVIHRSFHQLERLLCGILVFLEVNIFKLQI
jgi:hypothetical protein